MTDAPDYIVSCVGAGATLEGVQIAVQDYFREQGSRKKLLIGVAEHELSPLLAQSITYDVSGGSSPTIKASVGNINSGFYERIEGLPHIVIGPHYDEINPLLSKESIRRIGKVFQYSEDDWMGVQHYLHKRGIDIGNSSAANLSVAARLANKGNTVVTVIFEPFREFYKRHDTEREKVSWLFRNETALQRIAFGTLIALDVGAALCYVHAVHYHNAPLLPFAPM